MFKYQIEIVTLRQNIFPSQALAVTSVTSSLRRENLSVHTPVEINVMPFNVFSYSSCKFSWGARPSDIDFDEKVSEWGRLLCVAVWCLWSENTKKEWHKETHWSQAPHLPRGHLQSLWESLQNQKFPEEAHLHLRAEVKVSTKFCSLQSKLEVWRNSTARLLLWWGRWEQSGNASCVGNPLNIRMT